MALNDKVRIAHDVIISVIPDGTAVTSTQPVAGQIDLGEITTDGLTITQAAERTEHPMFGSAASRIIKKGGKIEIAGSFGETTPEVRAVVGLDREWIDPERIIIKNLRFDVLDKAPTSGELYVFHTVYVQDAEITSIEPIAWSDGNPVTYGFTATGYDKGEGVAQQFWATLVEAPAGA